MAEIREKGFVRDRSGLGRRKDGSTLWVSLNAQPWFDEQGRIAGMEGVARDITARMTADASLRESDERYRSLFDTSVDAIITTDEDGRIACWNRSAERMFGYAAAEVTGQPATVVVPQEYRDRHRAGLDRVKSGGEPHVIGKTVEMEGLRRDGSEFPLELSLTAWKVASGRFYTAIIRDITERKSAEEALRASEEQFRAMFDLTSVGVAQANPKTGRLLRVNPKVCLITGYSAEELLTRRFSDITHPDDRERDWTLFERTVTTGGSEYQIEKRYVRKDGSIAWANVNLTIIRDATGAPVRSIAMIMDITERRRAAEALAASEMRYRTLFENAAEGIIAIDADSKRFQFFNPALCAMFGYAPDEFGRLTLADVHGSLIEIAGRKVIFGFFADVTARLRLEAQFLQAQKMEAVGRLAGGVAHDFNNLLTVIQGYGELLHASLADDPERRESLGEIVKAAERAAALTRQLLAFSRQQVLEMRILDVGAVVADTEKMLKRLIGEDVEVVVVKPAALGRVKADPGQIEQVVLNLAVNARDAMPGGGSLTISVDSVTEPAPLEGFPEILPAGRWVRLTMEDTGCGMDAETLSHAFEPFFTTKERGKGTGLGLSTVYGIVRQSGGFVQVTSGPGKGTAFRVYLPRSDEKKTSGVRPSVRSRQGTETVLVAHDGAAALDLVDKHTGAIHVLLTDVVMPGMNGRELAERIVKDHPGVRILYMSGYMDDAVMRHGIVESGVAFLQKPFTPLALARKVREVLDGKAV
jgi:PAS domain S-box-containing protein